MKPYRIWKTKRDYVFVVAESPSKALQKAEVTGYYYWDIELITDEKIDKMSLEELEELDASFPKEVSDKADEILKAFGIALGEARAKWAEELMK